MEELFVTVTGNEIISLDLSLQEVPINYGKLPSTINRLC